MYQQKPPKVDPLEISVGGTVGKKSHLERPSVIDEHEPPKSRERVSMASLLDTMMASLDLQSSGPFNSLEELSAAAERVEDLFSTAAPQELAKMVQLILTDRLSSLNMSVLQRYPHTLFAAHIGVGISGQEGMQAVLSSNFSFAQFRFLQRLLLVHGRWSYLRMCKFLRYFFYKNFTFTFVHFWYAFFCGFSAQTVYDEGFIALYSLVYTSLPVLGMALFDQDVNDGWSLEFPQLYVPGQLSLYFSKTAFMKCALHSCYSSLVLFFVPYATVYDSMRSDGKEGADYLSFALLTQTCLTFTVCLQVLDLSYWTAVNHWFVWGSLGMYFIVTFTMQSDGLYQLHPPSFRFVGTSRNSLDQFSVWLTVFLTAVLCVLPVLVHRFIFIQLKPAINDKVRFKVHQKKDQRPSPQRRTKIRRSSTRRSGYAFSHAQGYGDLVTSKRFLW
ncbi:probable phospholipid-transporting ATPase IM [Colossoma macropomum]|uniref:probable phospholipid-transporting ATPase IM n=1 Tax=Colossoma macropomum TaxID=42526 RepID=UPI0018651C60|nr:probable phospholipid-transporting ATPase IM [Colossoma macropomum]